jgi:uncharacterized protein YecA (UPF0149 family)
MNDINTLLSKVGINKDLLSEDLLSKLQFIGEKLNNPSMSEMENLEYNKMLIELLDPIVQEGIRKRERKNIGKCGRNDMCPCGSSRKYKKCCM